MCGLDCIRGDGPENKVQKIELNRHKCLYSKINQCS